MQVCWRNCQVLSEQTSDSFAFINATCLLKYMYSTMTSIFHFSYISIRINCNRIIEGICLQGHRNTTKTLSQHNLYILLRLERGDLLKKKPRFYSVDHNVRRGMKRVAEHVARVDRHWTCTDSCAEDLSKRAHLQDKDITTAARWLCGNRTGSRSRPAVMTEQTSDPATSGERVFCPIYQKRNFLQLYPVSNFL
jgi:hypothetical protein